MRRQIDFVLEPGVSAVVACGKAGEFEGQSLEEIEVVLTTVLEHVNGRVPVGMGIISVEEDRGLPEAELATRCGADFAMTKKLTRVDPVRLLQPDRPTDPGDALRPDQRGGPSTWTARCCRW